MARYSTTLQVRFRDIDPLYHVSHTVYVVYMQQARLAFCEEVLGLSESEWDTVVAHLELDYESEVAFGDEVTAETWISDVGSSSFTMAYELSANGTVASRGESVQVVVDPDTGENTELPTGWREQFESYRDDGS
ncbi:acyl-CoA thioesterase [Salinirubellus sp. GCM10025818]|jgi:acyl-CoA thioester hydrolase|uniref:acyl-CoA thioesterase n=1 Tax=Salinirubellus TaxID=2162630 RepID=UPI0030D4D891